MDVLFWLLTAAVVNGGIIAGVSFDVALVKLPTRKRIGSVAYARFARGNDLGNGKIVYPILGIFTILLMVAVVMLALVNQAPSSVMTPVWIAVACTIAHSLCTGKAAPIMISLKDTPDKEQILTEKLNHFTYWHNWRAAFQVSAFIALVWALVSLN